MIRKQMLGKCPFHLFFSAPLIFLRYVIIIIIQLPFKQVDNKELWQNTGKKEGKEGHNSDTSAASLEEVFFFKFSASHFNYLKLRQLIEKILKVQQFLK